MAKMVMPLSRTVFLPRQAAPMAQVKGVQLEAQLLKVKGRKDATVCSGNLSVTVTYHPSLPGSAERIMEKVVLVPFQVECPGTLPPCAPSGCQITCSDTTWQMISPQAIELKTTLTLICEEVAEVPSIPLPVDEEEAETDLAIVPSDSEIAATMPNCCDFRLNDCPPPPCKPPVVMPKPLSGDGEFRFSASQEEPATLQPKERVAPIAEQSCDFRFAAPAAPASRAVVNEQPKETVMIPEPPAETAFRFAAEEKQPEPAVPVLEEQENTKYIAHEDPLLDCRIYQPIPEEVRIERGRYFPCLPHCDCDEPIRPTPPDCSSWHPCPPQKPEHRPEIPLPPIGSTPPVWPGPDENRPEIPLPPIGSTPPVWPGPDENRPEIPLPPIGSTPPVWPGPDENRPEIPLPPVGSTPPVWPGPDENRPEIPLPPIGSTPPIMPRGTEATSSDGAISEQLFDADLSQGETQEAPMGRVRDLPAPRAKKETVGNQYCLKFYLVQEGEDLSAVAEKQQVSQTALENANAVCEEDIRAGMVLNIPEEKSEKNE